MAELYHGLWNRVIFDFVTGRISKGKGKVDFIFQYHQAAINIFERPGAGAGRSLAGELPSKRHARGTRVGSGARGRRPCLDAQLGRALHGAEALGADPLHADAVIRAVMGGAGNRPFGAADGRGAANSPLQSSTEAP